MDDDARERLVRRTRDAMIEVRNSDGTTLEQARAALAVIEPAVREECIAIANRWSRDGQSATAHGIIEGIREAGVT